MKNKYIYMWFDGDVKRYYFSSKLTFNKWLNEFVDEFMKDSLNCNYFYKNLKLKSKQQVKKYFSGPMFLEKIYLDI